MQFIDLKAQYTRLQTQIDSRVQRVLEHGQYIMGPEVAELEQNLQNFVGVPHCISVANGTDALVIALRALGIGPGDVVVCPTFTFFATAESIALVGATPVFADSDMHSFNISSAWLEEHLPHLKQKHGDALKAIMAVDLFGLPADYAALETLCDAHELFLIADGAQAMGASQGGKNVGSFGHIATTSFFPAKPLGCFGDGGAIFTHSDELADICRSIRVHGKGSDKYQNVRIGTNSRLDTLQAAILLEKLAVLAEEIGTRQLVAERYTAALADRYELQAIPSDARSAWAQFSLLASKETREALQLRLNEAGVPTQVYYPCPLHLQTAFSNLAYKTGSLPNSEELSERIFSVPMGPYLAEDDQAQVITTLLQ